MNFKAQTSRHNDSFCHTSSQHVKHIPVRKPIELAQYSSFKLLMSKAIQCATDPGRIIAGTVDFEYAVNPKDFRPDLLIAIVAYKQGVYFVGNSNSLGFESILLSNHEVARVQEFTL